MSTLGTIPSTKVSEIFTERGTVSEAAGAG